MRVVGIPRYGYYRTWRNQDEGDLYVVEVCICTINIEILQQVHTQTTKGVNMSLKTLRMMMMKKNLTPTTSKDSWNCYCEWDKEGELGRLL